MASSDDEEVPVPEPVVANYYFMDEKEEPIPFSVLPIQFDEAEKLDAPKDQVFLHGATDGGLQKIYKQVTAWKLELLDDQPEISVLSKDNKWIKLLKPRKSYEENIRTILITVYLLHFLRRKPESSERSLWDHLRKVFSLYEDAPSVDDLGNHYSLIKLFAERDDTLAKSQVLQMLLTKKPRKKASGEALLDDSDAKKSFIVDVDEAIRDDDGDESNDDGSESEDETYLFDSVCAICDNGGELLCCEGRCMRSFHATRKDGEDSDCKSLGFSRAQVQAIQVFLCRNCRYKQHQCFACGKLGSSDKSVGAEVFSCVNATCGHFYHPKCVANLLYPKNETEAAECLKKIAAGESFTCPVHKCYVCKQGENKEVEDLQFAMCRRCPKSYHRKCLPREIAFEDIEDEDIIQRAWDDLLPNRTLIYCLKHEIDEDLGTPIRNHIIFPEIPERRRVVDVPKSREKVLLKKKLASEDLHRERTSEKPVQATKKITGSDKGHSLLKSGRSLTEQELDYPKKMKPLKDSAISDTQKADRSVPADSKKTLNGKTKASAPTVSPSSVGKALISSFPKIDADTDKKVTALVEKLSSSVTLEDILRKRTVPSTHAYSARQIDKNITQGKIEGSVEAIRAALQKLEGGSSVEDAKAVCEPDVLKQVLKWSSKLKVYLAPFLHGMRYTSFGRHFTKVDKLEEIVDKLQWYVQNGDMIVDFCCGANDFSQLMKEKLDAAGKKCSFRNYDVIQPKNDFNFEKKDWMKVRPKELPPGSQLIMGLNPPFGVKASLANKFIDKALTFRPKLLILIVPKETERLDEKNPPYDLIWEDSERLSGKSFYLPGSVDVNDKQMEQWNLKPPPLYLWSRSDWTAKHKVIAMKHGHTSKENQESCEERTQTERISDACPAEIHLEERCEERGVLALEKKKIEANNENPEQGNKKNSPENHKNNAEQSNKRSAPESRKKNGEQSNKSAPEIHTNNAEHSNKSAPEIHTNNAEHNNKSAPENHKKIAEQSNKKGAPENDSNIAGQSCKRSAPENHINNAGQSNKRSAPENPKSASRKKRKIKKKQLQVAEKRKSDEAELSDMSISPPDTRHELANSRPPEETFETVRRAFDVPMETQTPRETYDIPTERPDSHKAGLEYGTNSGVGRAASILDEGIDDIAKRYTAPSSRDGLFNSPHSWSAGVIGSRDYGIRSSEEMFSGYDNVDTFGRNSYMDRYGMSLDADTRMQQARPYSMQAQDDPLQRSRFSLGGSDGPMTSPGYGFSGLAAGSSALQRYAPRLDETNYVRGAGNLGPGAPFLGGRSGVFDVPGMRDMSPDVSGYALGPQRPFPRQGSGGWLND